MKTNSRFGIRKKHVMNSLQDHPASPGVSKWGCANCSLYWKAKELGESQQNKTPSWSLRLYCLYHQSEKWGRIRAIRMVSTLLLGTDYGCSMKPFFIEIQNFWAWVDKLGRLILGNFWYFRPNYQHPFWYNESLVHAFHHSTTIFLGFGLRVSVVRALS